MLKNAIMTYHYTLDWYVLNGEIVKLDQSFPQEMGTMGRSRLVSRQNERKGLKFNILDFWFSTATSLIMLSSMHVITKY